MPPLRTEPSVRLPFPPLAGTSLSSSATRSPSPVVGAVPGLDPAYALVDDLSPLTAIGATLPPPSLLAQTAVPAAEALDGRSGTASLPAAEAEAAGEGGRADIVPSGSQEAELTDEEQRQVEQLETRDREVHQHEQAHLSAAGGHARGGASYEYETGPDGKRYAVGGEVTIDTSKVSGDPEATIRKAQIIYRAALAPAEPSSQDRSIASQAKRMEMAARQEQSKEQIEEGIGGTQDAEASDPTQRDGRAADDNPVTMDFPGSAASPTTNGQDMGSLLDLLG